MKTVLIITILVFIILYIKVIPRNILKRYKKRQQWRERQITRLVKEFYPENFAFMLQKGLAKKLKVSTNNSVRYALRGIRSSIEHDKTYLEAFGLRMKERQKTFPKQWSDTDTEALQVLQKEMSDLVTILNEHLEN